MYNGVYVFCEKEFGFQYEAEVSDMWAPRNDSVLKLEGDRGSRATFSK